MGFTQAVVDRKKPANEEVDLYNDEELGVYCVHYFMFNSLMGNSEIYRKQRNKNYDNMSKAVFSVTVCLCFLLIVGCI